MHGKNVFSGQAQSASLTVPDSLVLNVAEQLSQAD
jgi:hypothetical protein